MKIKIISVFVLLILPFFLFAKPISVNDAEIVAKNLIFEKSGIKQESIQFENIISYEYNHNVVLYIFDIEGAEGFVLISSDDLYFPIIGYSLDSFFSLNNIPDNIKGLYDEFGKKIEWAKKNKISQSTEINKSWNKYNKNFSDFNAIKNVKNVLLTTANWNQSGGFDDWVPFDGDGTPPTGCVATAMGIVMKYWNFPLQGNGSTSYYESPYGTLTVNFGNSHYFWNLMDNSSSGNTFESHLLYHCGVAVHMNYDLDGSGAQVYYGSNSAYNALKNYFNYNPSMIYRERDNYTDAQWKQYLKDEIDAGRIMLYVGFNTDGGHAWVCDGYDDSDLFHYNFGWGGYDNGYYNINNVNGFTDDNGAIMNIEPNDINTYPNPPQNLTSELDTVDLSGFHVTLNWEAPAIKAISNYKIYRIDYDNESFHHTYSEINQVSASTFTFTDNSASPGNKEYVVQAIYTDAEGEAVADFVKGTFSTTFRVHDAEGNVITNNGINCQVTFNDKTQSTGFGSTTFNNVLFGTDKVWEASADGYPTTSGLIDIYKDNIFNIFLDGSGTNIQTNNSNKIFVYPNPVNKFLFVNISDYYINSTYQIVNINGKTLQHGNISSGNTKINTEKFSSGYYILKVVNNSEVLIIPFIKHQ